MRLIFGESFLRTLFSVEAMVDCVTCVPVLAIAGLHDGPRIYVPYFLRALTIVPHLRRLINVRMELHAVIRPIEPLRERLIVLVTTLIVILYIAMCSLAYVEQHWGNQLLSPLDLLYLVTVTISTVGYGDVTPKSQAGRVIVVITILVALSVVPNLISSVVEILRKKNGARTVHPSPV